MVSSLSSFALSGMVLLATSLASLSYPLPPAFYPRAEPDSTPVPLKVVHASGWYAGWVPMTPAQIPWEQYTELTFAFAVTTENSPAELGLLQQEAKLKEFVTLAKSKGVSALVSLGGWTGSRFFTQSVNSAANRTIFVETVNKLVTDYDLDGIDVDWEYPATEAMCNPNSPDDLENFRLFLEELRGTETGKNIILTAAAGIKPWIDASGSPATDVSAFAKLFDRVAIMGYDIHGGWAPSKTVGANAPIKAGCPASPDGGVSDAIDAWVAAGFPAEQLTLAVPAYGRSFTVDQSAVSGERLTSFNPAFSAIPLGEGETTENTSGIDPVCGVDRTPGGIYNYNALQQAGYLTAAGEPAAGVKAGYDTCTETPFMFTQDGKFITYDDAQSFTAKGALIAEKGLAGFAVWHVSGDSTDNALLTSIHKALGTESVECGSEDEAPPAETQVPASPSASSPSPAVPSPSPSPSQSAAAPGTTSPPSAEGSGDYQGAADAGGAPEEGVQVEVVTHTTVVVITQYVPAATPA